MSRHREKQRKERNTPETPVSHRSELRSLVARVAALVTELEQAMTNLPHVDSYGYSPCPPKVVQELYGRKEKAEQQVAAYIPTLTEILSVLEKEVERCQKNLDRIRADAGQLRLKETQEKYGQAEQAQELQLRQAKDDRDAVYVVLKKAELALQISRGRQMPNVKRKEKDGSADRKKGGGQGPCDNCSEGREKPTLKGEFDGLVSLGPRARSRDIIRRDMTHGTNLAI